MVEASSDLVLWHTVPRCCEAAVTQIVEVIKNTKGESKGSGKAKGGAVFLGWM